MREPLTKFPKRPVSARHTRNTIAECKALLANQSLSPEMRTGLKLRIEQLEEELRAQTTAPAQHDDKPAR